MDSSSIVLRIWILLLDSDPPAPPWPLSPGATGCSWHHGVMDLVDYWVLAYGLVYYGVGWLGGFVAYGGLSHYGHCRLRVCHT